MTRILILLLAAYLLARGVQAALRQLTAGNAPSTRPTGPEHLQEAGKLVRCAECKTHVPEDRARRDGKLSFCSDECLRKAGAAVAF